MAERSRKGANDTKNFKKQPIANNKGDASDLHGPSSNVHHGCQYNKGGDGGNSSNDSNALHGDPGNGSKHIWWNSEDSKKQPIEDNKGKALDVHESGSNVTHCQQTNKDGAVGASHNGGTAGPGGLGDGNNIRNYDQK